MSTVAEAVNELAAILEARGEYTYETINVKRWVLGDGGRSGNCEECVGNADLGWVDDDAVFTEGDEDVDGPPLHPHCTCELEYGERRKRVYA